MKPHTVGDASQEVDETMRRLRVVLMCIVGLVGLWDVTVTFGPGRVASDLARRGEIRCSVAWSHDGQAFAQQTPPCKVRKESADGKSVF
jgi:hypothetical protein